MKKISWTKAKIGDCLMVEKLRNQKTTWVYSVFILDNKIDDYDGKGLYHIKISSIHLDKDYSFIDFTEEGAGFVFPRWKTLFLLNEKEKVEYYTTQFILNNLK